MVQRQHQLLRRLQGRSVEASSSIQAPDACQVPADDVHAELTACLQGKRCLLVLDDVRSSNVVSHFKFDGFQGALLVTGLNAEAWPDASDDSTVVITGDKVQADPCKESGTSRPALAVRLLASRALNNVAATAVPKGCEVS